MPSIRYQALGPLPSAGGSGAFLGLAIIEESRAEPVVLVWVPEDLARDFEKSERLQRETERIALLDHPHLVRVYGFARMEEGRLARVVEFADGENLRRVLDTAGPLPASLAARLVADAAQGVHYAHLAGNDDGTPLLHGDLRPETLLVTFRGQCKVAGYGAAAFAPRENRPRELRVAPEQILGGRAAKNVQTDVYLVGATLFECLTGKAPFQDAADFEQAVLSEALDLDAQEMIPPALREVIARALAKKAADRFPSAHLLREAIELAAQPLPGAGEAGQWLTERFPDADGMRAERQAVIDRGIADFARSRWAQMGTAATPAAPTAVPPAAPAAAQTVAPPPQVLPTAPPPGLRSRLPSATLVAGLLVLAAAALLWFLPRRQQLPEEAAPPPATPAPAVVDAGPAAADAGRAAATPPAPMGTLALSVDPPVAVEIDGAPVGRAPVKVALSPGRHRVHLVDRRRGVDVHRVVVVASKGETRETIRLARGFVRVSAPAGAVITLDGKTVGKAPMNTEIELYEGNHRLDVTVGASKWGENFRVEPNQHVTFEVGAQYR